MQIVDTVETFTKALDAARHDGRRVGLVPTMGWLHDGHTSLIRRAAAECDVVAVTLFVNPLQFGDATDFGTYPRDLDRDGMIATEAGAHVLFAPSVAEMYPDWPARCATTVSVSGSGLTGAWEGASRPGHFEGVATVVAKLFAMAGRCTAYFGEKDYQQLCVVRRMAADLSFPVTIVGCPTVREPDGLAMSSRNVHLTAEERAAAPVLWRALQVGAALVERGEKDPAKIAAAMEPVVGAEPLAGLDYAAVVDPDTLVTPMEVSGPVRLLLAAGFPSARLIDNCAAIPPVPAPDTKGPTP